MTAEQLAQQSCFSHADATRIVAALEDVPEHFLWAMVQAGCFSADEIIERLRALKSCLKQGT